MSAFTQLPPRREAVAISLMLLTGFGIRFGWFVASMRVRALGEAYNVATALATGRGFVDAYQLGQGPTAHLTPITPVIASVVYRLFGINSVTSEAILGCWSITLALTTYVLLYRAFGRLGVPQPIRLAALLFLCVAPAYFWVEAVDFRIWDGGLAACLTALFLDRLLATDTVSVRTTWPLAVIAALLFFVNPIWGLAAYGCATVYCLARAPLPSAIGIAAVAFAVLIMTVAPWAIRNALVMDRAVLLRSNSGLEMALAMHPAAVDGRDPAAVFLARSRAIHPTNSLEAYAAMRTAGGEATYAQALGAATWRWMQTEPEAAAKLAVRHVRQALFPDGWQFSVLGGSERGGSVRAAMVKTIAAFALAGLALMLAAGRREWIYPTILLTLPALAMAPFQPVQRYTYLFYPLLLFSATGCLVASRNLLRRRS